jgi:uncharacterized protein (UPF0276 family)
MRQLHGQSGSGPPPIDPRNASVTSVVEPINGFGLGLRREHYSEFIDRSVPVDFVEVISENFMIEGGRPLRILDQVRENYPVALHGVSLSIGSASGIDVNYLNALKTLINRVQPLWVSDHLCWTRSSAHNSHDLLPLPLNEETFAAIRENVIKVQDTLERSILLENPSTYISLPQDEIREWDFLNELCEQAGCFILLDINNVFVNSINHGFSAKEYVNSIDTRFVRQIHLAGHTPGEILIDTHDRPVCGAVWDLYATACARLGPVATLLERDGDIPPLATLIEELEVARTVAGSRLAP